MANVGDTTESLVATTTPTMGAANGGQNSVWINGLRVLGLSSAPEPSRSMLLLSTVGVFIFGGNAKEVCMSEARPRRSRSTHAVLSNVPGLDRWWQPATVPAAAAISRHKELRFHSGDPFERFVLVRYAIIAISIITPAVILMTSKFTAGTAQHHDWSADPMQEVRRSLQSGQQQSALDSLRAEAKRAPQTRQFCVHSPPWRPTSLRQMPAAATTG